MLRQFWSLCKIQESRLLDRIVRVVSFKLCFDIAKYSTFSLFFKEKKSAEQYKIDLGVLFMDKMLIPAGSRQKCLEHSMNVLPKLKWGKLIKSTFDKDNQGLGQAKPVGGLMFRRWDMRLVISNISDSPNSLIFIYKVTLLGEKK